MPASPSTCRGDNRTVLKVFWGRFNFNSADKLADQENPVGRAQLRYAFNDLNGNRLLDGPQELGPPDLDPGRRRLRAHRSRPEAADGAGDVGQPRARDRCRRCRAACHTSTRTSATSGAKSTPFATPAYTVPFTIIDRGADNRAGTADDQTFQTFDRPASIGSDRVYTNPDEQQGRLPDDRGRAQSPLHRSLDAADVVRLHVAEPDPRLVDDGVVGQRPGLQLSPGRSDVRRQRLRDVDAVELQGHRPLHAAVRRSACRGRGRSRAAAIGADR